MKNRVLLLSFALICFLCTAPADNTFSQDDESWTVGTRAVPPFVIDNGDGTYSGISVELWGHIASEMEISYTFEETDLQGMLDGVADGSYDASISAITITSEREELVDFTHPFFVTGLGIAVSYKPAGIWQAMMALFSGQFWWVVFLLVLLLLFWGLLIWIFERKANTDEFGGKAAEGIGSGFWWAAVTMTTVGYGDKAPVTFAGRVVGFVWMFAAIILISFFTASIASSLTVSQLDSRVDGPQDLPFVRVGALEASATSEWLSEERIRHQQFDSIQAGLQAVSDDEIDAFVHDAPIIRYYSNTEFPQKVRVLPNTFNDQYYGIALPLESEYRNQMNRVLLDFISTQEWDEIQSRYMGD